MRVSIRSSFDVVPAESDRIVICLNASKVYDDLWPIIYHAYIVNVIQ